MKVPFSGLAEINTQALLSDRVRLVRLPKEHQ
jgi:hypothetical protein